MIFTRSGMYVGETVTSSAAQNFRRRDRVDRTELTKLNSSHGPKKALVRITNASECAASTFVSASSLALPIYIERHRSITLDVRLSLEAIENQIRRKCYQGNLPVRARASKIRGAVDIFSHASFNLTLGIIYTYISGSVHYCPRLVSVKWRRKWNQDPLCPYLRATGDGMPIPVFRRFAQTPVREYLWLRLLEVRGWHSLGRPRFRH